MGVTFVKKSKKASKLKEFNSPAEFSESVEDEMDAPTIKLAIDTSSLKDPDIKESLDSFKESKSDTATKLFKKVALISATQLYQPVASTDSTSTYHVVGIGERIKVAARYKSGTMSIRVEGELKDSEIVKLLDDSGFTFIGHAQYTSMHLAVGNEIGLAKRTLGAVIGDLAEELDTGIPILTKFYKEGT